MLCYVKFIYDLKQSLNISPHFWANQWYTRKTTEICEILNFTLRVIHRNCGCVNSCSRCYFGAALKRIAKMYKELWLKHRRHSDKKDQPQMSEAGLVEGKGMLASKLSSRMPAGEINFKILKVWPNVISSGTDGPLSWWLRSVFEG